VRIEEDSVTGPQRYEPPSDEQAEFGRRLHELMGQAVLSVCDQAGVELGVAIAQRLDAGEYRVTTSLELGADGQPDPLSLRFHVLVEADNGLLELCSARWSALGVPEDGAREEARWTSLQNGIGVPADLSELDNL
jgi:hypothetical protein